VRSCSQILREIDITAPAIICANKIDVISSDQLEDAKEIIRKYFLGEEIIPVSTKTRQNLEKVQDSIRSQLKTQKLIVSPRKHQVSH
jgi:50S ribosomal subunit-associated GTPase HflX